MTRVPLGEVCDFVYGEGLVEAHRRQGNVPVYGSNGNVGWHDRALTEGPTIIIGRKGSIGEINYSQQPCWPIDTTYYVEKTKKPCDLKWLYFTLLALELTSLNKSAAVPGLNRDDAYEKLIPLPSLSEQKRIAAILEKADRVRRLRRTALQLSDGFLQSVFLEMFGEIDQFENAELGDLLCEDPKNGLYLPAKKYGTGTPIVRITDFYDGVLAATDTFKRVDASPKEIREFQICNDDILVNRVNSLEYLGKCALVKGLRESTLFESNMMRLRVDTSKVHQTYVVAFLSSQQCIARFLLLRRRRLIKQA